MRKSEEEAKSQWIKIKSELEISSKGFEMRCEVAGCDLDGWPGFFLNLSYKSFTNFFNKLKKKFKKFRLTF
jgi:hypothetical protein